MDMQGSPQTGDGFVRIANELFDALLDVRIPGEVRRVFDYILRMTYGYNRKTFETTQHKIAQRLKTSQQRVYEALRWLTDANMITNTKNRVDLSANCLTTLGIQKRYRLWRTTRKSVLTRKTVLKQNGKACRLNTEKRVELYVKDNFKDNSKDKGVGRLSDPPSAQDPIPRNEKPEKRRRQLPIDFSLSDELKAYAEGQGINGTRVESVFAHFCDHHRAKGSTMLDWTAAWRTWVRNEKRFGSRADRKSPPAELLKPWD
jgi:phage replication O-like protein O